MEVVTGVASSVAEKILGYPVRLIGRHLCYLINYQTNKKNLTDRVPKLNEKISSIQRRARAAQRNGEQLEECVTGWISEAERKIQEANDVINDRGHENAKCLCNGSFPNLLSRYKLSKQAKLMADNILIDLQNADNFRNFSYRPDVQPSFKNKDYEAFDTRMQTSKEIMKALRDPNLTMIGVYGMGGIGKTTLVTDVARQAKEEECFSELVMVTVSQDFDLKSIQNGIAEGLGLTLDGENMSVRAKRLQNRLRQENKILIILDDIWDELDLSKAGINFNADDQKGCKILLVSRVRDVLCNKMGVRKIIEVKVLSDSEAQGLFNKFVGDIDDNSDFKELANQVVGECGGLPIAIVTIACSLKNKDLVVWNGFLSQLKSSRGLDRKVYASIKMSYDFLESEEEKKLLLLCSLHGEDANVYVNHLMFYGIGLDLFQEVRAMEEARCWVHSLVDKLKAHCLLLDGDACYRGTVKMHDVIRDVMISIAKKDEHLHCLTKVADLEDCLHKENFRDSKAIVLLGPDFNNQLLPSLVCPKLQLLLACHTWNRPLSLGSIPDDFFQEAQELKALRFFCEPLESLPQSFCTLRHLRALRLRLGKKADLTLIGELRNLIALDLSESTFSQLPEHIGKLTRLQSLNLSYCYSLRVIQPNVISSLVRLEELYMDEVNIDWEVEGRVGEGRNASLVELKNLRNLTTLHLNVRDANVMPKDMFSENLQRYRIIIGSIAGSFASSRFLYLNLRESIQLYQYGIQKLMKNSEWLWLEEFHGVDNIVYELDIYSFPQLKNFCLENNDEVRYIVHSTEEIQPCTAFQNLETLNLENLRNLEKICYGNVTMESFGKLRKINVRNCDKLKNLFSFSIARKFEEIVVSGCKMMEMFEENEREKEMLNCFLYSVVFPVLKVLQLCGMNFIKLWSTTSCMQNLSSLDVFSCRNLKYLFTVAMAGRLAQLERLKIRGCPEMEEVVVTNEHGEGRSQKISFPKLQSLKLEDLPNLKRFCTGDCIECPSLLTLEIRNCGVLRKFIYSNEEEVEGPFFNEKVSFPILEELQLKRMNLKILWADQLSITSFGMQNLKRLFIEDIDSLSHLFSLDVARSLQQLEDLQLEACKNMEEVLVTKEPTEEGTAQKISFPKLKNLVLSNLQNIRRFCAGCCIEFPSLTNMTFITNSCNGASGESMGSEARQPLFNGKVSGPNLVKLTTTSSELIKEMCDCQSSRALPFCNLKVVNLKCFRNEPIGFSLKCIQRYQNLESLSLIGFFVDTTHHHQQLLVSSEEHERPLKPLKKLRLFQLFMLTHLYEDSEDSENSSLESLKFLHILECGKLMSPLLSLTSFQNLMALVVSECSAMINLLASSTAKTLVHLRLMSITECKQMTEIIADGIMDDEIVFRNLEILELCDLPSLKSFHSAGNSVIRFPNLVMLVVSQCPEMRRFSFGTIVTPKLDSISKIKKNKYQWRWLNDGNFDSKMLQLPEPQQKLWDGDINKTLEKLWAEDYSLVMQQLFTET
ncbi:hypothetical protein UlMin_033771 [Ulmus minor]